MALRKRLVLGVCGVNEDVEEEADDDGREIFRAADAVDDVLTKEGLISPGARDALC